MTSQTCVPHIRQKSSFVLALLLVLGACTGGKRGGGASDNTLRYPMIADAKTMDPPMVDELYSHYSLSLVYEGLVGYHYLKREPHTLVPVLAEAIPQSSKDGLTYVFKIKKGVRFADDAVFPDGKGRELKAKDFVYSLMRAADPKLNAPQFWLFDNRIVGLNEWREKQKTAPKTDYDAPLEGLKALDDYTLQIKLKAKYPQLMYALAMPGGYAVAREAVEKLGKDFVSHPVGTGPYKLASWVRNSKLTFERNPTFHGATYPTDGDPGDQEKGLLADAGKPIPFADKVELHVFVESQPQWLNFLSGNLDASGIPKDNYKQAIDDNSKDLVPDLVKKGITLQKVPEPDLVFTAFNMEDPVIKKGGPNLRHAIALAMDKKRFIEVFYNGRAVPAQSFIPPGIPGYDEKFVNPYSDYNLEKAKELLAKAGYPGGKGLPPLVYESTQGSDSRQIADKFQMEMAKLGIQLKINVNQFSELTEKINKRQAQIWGMGWIADYPEAENFLQLMYGPNKAPSPNGSNFDNPEYNKLFEQMRGMADSPERRAIITKMNKVFVEEMPYIVEAHRVLYALNHAWLKNFKPEFMGGIGLQYMRVDTERRAKGLNAAP